MASNAPSTGRPFLFALLSIVVLASCSGTGSGTAAKARTVLEEATQADPEVARYVLSIAGESTSPVVREFVMSAVNSPRRDAALLAMRALGDPPPPDSRPHFAQAFEAGKGAVKLHAAVALAHLGDADALEWIRESVSSGSGSMNVDAIKLVAEHDGAEALEPMLKKTMGNEDQGIRDEVYAILGEIRQPWATSLLLEGLENEFGEQRVQAILALGRTGEARVANELQRFVNTKGLVFASIEGLGALGNADAVPALEAMAQHELPLVRAYAGVSLWRVGAVDQATAVLEPLLEVPDPDVRRQLAEQLDSVEDPAGTTMLLRLAADQHKPTRVSALRGLTGRTSPEIEGLALTLLSQPDDELRILALNVLARCGGTAALDQLAPILDDPNPYLAVAASTAILSIESRGPS